MNKRLIFLILITIVIIIFFFYALSEVNQNDYFLKTEGEISFCTLYDTDGQYYKYRYTVEGQEFSRGKNNPYQYLHDNEKYELRYEKNNPENSIVIFERPVLREGIDYDTTDVKSYQNRDNRYTVTYSVQNRTYKRIFILESEFNNFQIIYEVNRPFVGYLLTR